MNSNFQILSLLLIILSACDLTYALVLLTTDYSYPVSYFTPFIKLLTFVSFLCKFCLNDIFKLIDAFLIADSDFNAFALS